MSPLAQDVQEVCLSACRACHTAYIIEQYNKPIDYSNLILTASATEPQSHFDHTVGFTFNVSGTRRTEEGSRVNNAYVADSTTIDGHSRQDQPVTGDEYEEISENSRF
jgi:hypothetical protein